jgi:hypothetical protein
MCCGKLDGLSAKIMVICFYAFREIYVSLLSSQQWAFISTTLDRQTSSYLVSFSGIVSIASAVGGCTTVQLVNVGGVEGLLSTTLIAVILGLCCAELANYLLEKEKEKQGTGASVTESSLSNNTGRVGGEKDKGSVSAALPATSPTKNFHKPPKSSFVRDSWNLISKNNILRILFYEAITHQFCSNMLNLMFHNGLRSSTESGKGEGSKAKIVGRFFATVNVIASLLKLFFFPMVLSQATLPYVLRYIPFLVLFAVLAGVFRPGTVSVMLGFGTIKILEYSCFSTAAEMIYMPLGHEVRYVGKELIKFFGQKLGKSVASLVLSFVITRFELSLVFQSIIGALLTVVWGITIFSLSDYLLEQDLLTLSSGIDSPGMARGRTQSEDLRINEELRLTTSRSMPLFELPPEEDESAVFFKSRSSSDDDQPEDFYYGVVEENKKTYLSSDSLQDEIPVEIIDIPERRRGSDSSKESELFYTLGEDDDIVDEEVKDFDVDFWGYDNDPSNEDQYAFPSTFSRKPQQGLIHRKVVHVEKLIVEEDEADEPNYITGSSGNHNTSSSYVYNILKSAPFIATLIPSKGNEEL